MLVRTVGLFSPYKHKSKLAKCTCLWARRGDDWAIHQTKCFEELDDYVGGGAPVFRLRQTVKELYIVESIEINVFYAKTHTAIIQYKKGVTDTPEGLWSYLACRLKDFDP